MDLSESRSRLFAIMRELTTGEAAGPPSGAARPFTFGSLAGFGDHRLCLR
jgi:hypothetical protein